MSGVFIGTAGWSIPTTQGAGFPGSGSHLERYAARMNAIEINTSFYRPHRTATDACWPKAPVACEPRHSSWFGAEADQLPVAAGVTRVMADPPPAPGADKPGGWRGLAYLRLHGVPRIYCSDYEADALAGFSGRLRRWQDEGRPAWCIFDKTAAFHALGNALALQASLRS